MIHVWYHAGCWDGFGAAWAAYRSSLIQSYNRYTFSEIQYGAPFPSHQPFGRDDKVYFLDFVPKLEQMKELLDSGVKVLVLDHHKTAAEEYEGFAHRRAEIHFSSNHSGAVMAWEFFNPGLKIPRVLEYIEDRDLWLHKLPNSERINAAIRSYSLDFSTWDNLFAGTDTIPASFEMEGGAILRANAVTIDYHIKRARTISIGHYPVLSVNATSLFSEIAGRLAELSESGIGCAFFQRADEKWQYSLRSRGEVDVSDIAKLYDGGGHEKSAGFERSINI